MAVPSLLTSALHCALFLAVFGPAMRRQLTEEIDGRALRDEMGLMGPMTAAEKRTLLWTVVAVVLWATDRLHGVNPAWVSLVCAVGLALPYTGGVLTADDLSRSVSWPTVVFVAGASAIGNVAGSAGISEWLSSLLTPVNFPAGVLEFALVAAVAVIVTHLLVGSSLTALALAGPVLIPVGTRLGFNPAIPCLIVYIVSNMQFVFPFQNLIILVGQDEPHGYGIVETMRFAPFITALTLLSVALLYAPWWAAIGLLHSR